MANIAIALTQNAASLSQSVGVTVTCSPPATQVQILVDGGTTGVPSSPDVSAPWNFTFDTTKVANGVHELKAVCVVKGVQQTQTLSVTVANAAATFTVSLTGTAIQGQTLTAVPSPAGSYTYLWRLCDANGLNPVNTATTSSTYLLGAGDIGHTLRVVATSSGVSVTSAQSAVVAGLLAPANTVLPTVSGGTSQVPVALGTSLPARLPFSSGGGVYYVDPVSGNDSYTTTQAQSRSTPWLTINHAIAVVPLAGATIKVLPATLSAGGLGVPVFKVDRLFSVSNPLTIMAETRGTVKIRTTQVDNSWGVWVTSATGARIQDFEFDALTNTTSLHPQTHIVVQGSSRIEITGCTFYGSGEKGVQFRGGLTDTGLTGDDLWVYGCTFRPAGTNPFAAVTGLDYPPDTYYGSRGSHWMYVGAWGSNPPDPPNNWEQVNGTRRAVIANNVFVGSTWGRHIELGPEARDGFVVNNTFYGNHAIQIYTGVDSSYTPRNMGACGVIFFANAISNTYKCGNNVVANNIFVDLDGHAVGGGAGGTEDGNVVHHNLSWNNRNGMGSQGDLTDYWPNSNGTGSGLTFTVGVNRPDADPLFVTPSSYDFHLQNTSPAIGQADPAYTPPIDITGASRGIPSLGAYEGVGVVSGGGGIVVGQTLTATTGSWTGTTPITYAYQWLRCQTVAGGTQTAIAGATGSSYVVVAADGGYQIRVRVTATNVNGSVAATSLPTATVFSVTISGTLAQGQTLVATPNPSGTYTWNWLRCDVNGLNGLSVGTASTYLLTANDVGHTMRVTATSGGVSVTSVATSVVSASVSPTRINAGGLSYIDTQGNTWSADGYNSGGNSFTTTAVITGTPDQTLYKSLHWNTGPFTYTFTGLSAGSYQVTLKFAETAGLSAGQRRFNITINGVSVATNLDVSGTVGQNAALDQTFTTTAVNNQIAIAFSQGAVDYPIVSAIQVLPVGSSPSGEAMPLGDLPGWRQIFTDDFNTPLAIGQFPSAVGTKWAQWFRYSDNSYNPAPYARYANDYTVSFHDGVMDIWQHTETIGGVATHLIASPVPLLNGGANSNGQTYGRYAVRFRADSIPYYKIAFLLWPISNIWAEGEIDFPEGDLLIGSPYGFIGAYFHRKGNVNGLPQDFYEPSPRTAVSSGWHTCVTEWMPTYVKFYFDGVLIGTSTTGIPTTPMYYSLQSPVDGGQGVPTDLTQGHILIDWVAIYAPV